MQSLSAYHPKPRIRERETAAKVSGSRTPLWSGLGFGLGSASAPYDEKTHYKYLSGALAKEKEKETSMDTQKARNKPNLFASSANIAADAESEGHELMVQIKGKKKGANLGGTDGVTLSAPTETFVRPRFSRMATHSSTSRAAKLINTYSTDLSRAATPSAFGHSGAHTPSQSHPSAANSIIEGEGEATLVSRTISAIKSALLHDARNLAGDAEISANLTWNINSTHDAKVRVRLWLNSGILG